MQYRKVGIEALPRYPERIDVRSPAEFAAGRPVALATLVGVSGGAPRPLGSRMLANADVVGLLEDAQCERQEAEENTERVHRYERTYGVFERAFALPTTVDPEKIAAALPADPPAGPVSGGGGVVSTW